ncbi:MAG: homocysteine S-methyltransferase family protein, partial [Gemmatimonadetes bacterium]|nr:homocysteine S-methyltransferase family protein [Gemmatimonadota bacterium]
RAFPPRPSAPAAAPQGAHAQWSGTVVLYPDAGRTDYLETWQDSSVANEETADELTQEATKWIETGAQVIGTCCGFGANYTKALSTALPDRVNGC